MNCPLFYERDPHILREEEDKIRVHRIGSKVNYEDDYWNYIEKVYTIYLRDHSRVDEEITEPVLSMFLLHQRL
jgi:hypothetical protein